MIYIYTPPPIDSTPKASNSFLLLQFISMGGICSSYESTSVATAKLIMQDGQLQEFPYPVKVSHVLEKYPSYFICNSDDLDFNDYVKAIANDEQLYPGQLYFALPMNKLKHRLHAEELAQLAVKASLALVKSSDNKYGCCLKGVNPITDVQGCRTGQDFTIDVSDVDVAKKRDPMAGGGGTSGRRSFAPKLTAIPE